MDTYNVDCDLISSGHGSESRKWKDLNESQMLKMHRIITDYFNDLYKFDAKDLKRGPVDGDLEPDPSATYTMTSRCVISKNNKEWAIFESTAQNQSPLYLTLKWNAYLRSFDKLSNFKKNLVPK